MSSDPAIQSYSPEVSTWITEMIDRAAEIRLPDLREGHPDAIFSTIDRNGVTTVVLRTTTLREDQLIDLMKFRLAQYLAVNFVDPAMVYAEQIEHEPRSGVSDQDIHVISVSAESGEILCYAAVKAPPDAPTGTTLRDTDRPHFPVEKVHGFGVYGRLRILPDLPIAKLREVGRFVKNQRLTPLDELGARAPVEVGVALFRSLAGPLRLEVDAIVGDLEEGVAKQNLDFFHAPMVVIHGTVPYEAEASYFFPRYQFCTVYPFAALATDISQQMLSRLDAIESALDLPGKAGLLSLFRLKRDVVETRSTLIPPEGLAPLTDANLPQKGVAMASRRQMLDLASQLRQTGLFAGLSVAEATVLGTFMERVSVPAGDVIVRQGETGDDMYLIESGIANVQISQGLAEGVTVATLGPGDFFGEIALLTGEERIADVVAAEPMTLLRLDRDSYDRYLAHAAEVEQQMTRAAMSRTRETTRRMISGS